jgi:hypothetical protein
VICVFEQESFEGHECIGIVLSRLDRLTERSKVASRNVLDLPL